MLKFQTGFLNMTMSSLHTNGSTVKYVNLAKHLQDVVEWEIPIVDV